MEKAPIRAQADREPNPLTPLSFAAESGGGGAISDLGAGPGGGGARLGRVGGAAYLVS